jgi:hypothetical protein
MSILAYNRFDLFVNLDELRLYNNNIFVLNKLPSNVVNVQFNYNDITEVTSLAGLTSLQALGLYHNSKALDVAPLVGLSSLIELRLHNTVVDYPLTGLSWFTATSGTFRFDSTVDSEDEVDQWIIDLAAANWSNCTIYLDGTNPARTGASDAALATLIANGCEVHVNE